jgi:AraC family transcriptional regulator
VRNDLYGTGAGAVSSMTARGEWLVGLMDGAVCRAALHESAPWRASEHAWAPSPGCFLILLTLQSAAEHAVWSDQDSRRYVATPGGHLRICDMSRAWRLSANTGPLTLLSLCFPGVALARLCAPDGIGLTRFQHPPDEAGHSDRVLHQLALAIAGLSAGGQPGGERGIEHLIQAMLLHVGQHYTRFETDIRQANEGMAPWQLRRAQDFMRARLGDRVSLAEIAATCDLSPSYFGRLFKHATGLTTHQWLMVQRVERAKILLATTPMSLVDIARDTGFADQTHFTRVFSGRMRSSPMAWRRTVQCRDGGEWRARHNI